MPIKGVWFKINDSTVVAPDEVVWIDIPAGTGEALSGRQKLSPYKYCEWRKQVAGPCHLDWHDYENQVLQSLTTPPPGELDEVVRYTDAIAQGVGHRQRHGIANEMTMRFLVYAG